MDIKTIFHCKSDNIADVIIRDINFASPQNVYEAQEYLRRRSEIGIADSIDIKEVQPLPITLNIDTLIKEVHITSPTVSEKLANEKLQELKSVIIETLEQLVTEVKICKVSSKN